MMLPLLVLLLWPQSSTSFQHARSIEHNPITLYLERTLDQDTTSAFLEEAISTKPCFSDVSSADLPRLIDAFEEVTYTQGDCIVQQGDSAIGDYVYIIADGECTVQVDGEVVPEPYGTMGSGEIFGDLAVLYDEPRSATILAKSDTVTLYRVFWETFRTFVFDKRTVEQMQEIDQVINQVSGSITLYQNGTIIPQYKPERTWLWTKWTGTILQVVYKNILFNTVVSLAFVIYANHIINGNDTVNMDFFLDASIPDPSHPLVQRLATIHDIWTYLQGLATFVLTFFLNQAYTFWRKVYDQSRNIQGRMNDLQMLVVASTIRNPKDGSLTPEAQELIDDIGQYSRLFHALLWATVAKRFDLLLTQKGLKRMVTRGLITTRQLDILNNDNLPESKLHRVPLEWILVRMNLAMDKGILYGDNATKRQLMMQICEMRASFADIQDKLDARMPLAYSHLVQLLVDSLTLLSPLALYPDMGDYSIFAVLILTLFYDGLLNLAKIFLDPLNNEEFCENAIFMDLGVFIRESNANTLYWKYSGEEMPFDYD